ncbi:hypothetical protein [Prosthecomicrobium sp. N25]|uniref:hypothetical protein n=1 Tax=Prosthecomicrobium sp. N25 TaxID=3129254 RepID=UPI003076FCB1
MKTTVTRLYDRYQDAAAAVNALMEAGFPAEDVSLVVNNAGNPHLTVTTPVADAPDAAGAGAGAGALLGGGAGLLAGLGLMAIPGLGPVVAAGWLAATAAGAVAGAAAGAAAGGIVDALTASGVNEEHANVYAESLRRGGALVTARAEEDRVGPVEAVLDRFSPVDPDERGRSYRESGWSRFDANLD